MKNVIKIFSILLAVTALTACGQSSWETVQPAAGPAGPQGPVGPQGPAAPTPTPAPTATPVAPTAVSFGSSCPANTSCIFATATENQTTTASCASGVITVSASNYFVDSSHTESCLAYAAASCNGLQSCSLDFTDSGCAGDPDVGVVKSANLTLSCSAPANQSAVNALIAQYNALRTAQGQDQVTQGLTCSLYTVPTSTTAIIGATLTGIGSWGYTGQFDVANGPVTSGLNILPIALQSIYQTWYIVKCYGEIVNTDNAWHSFSITSDDGSNLYVDGLLVNNDGLHSSSTKSGTKFLSAGVHSFEVDYFQGGGYESLIVNEDGSLLQSNVLFH